jgi:xylulose-5-phosphate/fructose-6-phosphate phosphoketolase
MMLDGCLAAAGSLRLRLTYCRTNHGNLHVRGYKEEGTTTTPLDMTVLNTLDRFHLVMDIADRVPRLQGEAATSSSECATS